MILFIRLGTLVAAEGKDGIWTIEGAFGMVGQPPSRYQIQVEWTGRKSTS
jgi:hypothetical protein